jgi:hypothetical protein
MGYPKRTQKFLKCIALLYLHSLLSMNAKIIMGQYKVYNVTTQHFSVDYLVC